MRRLLLCVGILAAVAIASFAVIRFRGGEATPETVSSAPLPRKSAGGDDSVVRLSKEKREFGNIRTAPAAEETLQATVTVPGRVQYDDNFHIEIRAPSDGVLERILVKPGDFLEAGQLVATLSSREIGTARAEVLRRDGELDLAVRKHEWEKKIGSNAALLIESIRSEKSREDIDREFRTLELGELRERLLTAYSRFELAKAIVANTNAADLKDVLPMKTVKERQSEYESARSSLDGLCEQVLFDARQRVDMAYVAVDDAKRLLEVSQQNLTTLLGHPESIEEIKNLKPEENISLAELRAPFAGWIERRVIGVYERVTAGAPLFVLADTRRLWVEADVREAEWTALNQRVGQEIEMESIALPGKMLKARVYFIGREVSGPGQAIPVMASIDNPDGWLRPGLFVRVALPVGPPRDVLAVPLSALLQHESRQYVFVEAEPNVFRRIQVQVGLEVDGKVEITSGLKPGDPVVAEGAFVLLSELLLEREE